MGVSLSPASLPCGNTRRRPSAVQSDSTERYEADRSAPCGGWETGMASGTRGGIRPG
jgi:hypothetical protein